MARIASESIKTVGRLGYFKLFDRYGALVTSSYVDVEDGTWKKLFWRIYWRI